MQSKCDPEYFSCLAIETGHEMTFTTQLKFVVKDQSCDRESVRNSVYVRVTSLVPS